MHEFAQQNAINLLAKMRGFYGKKFIDQWAKIDKSEIISAMMECLADLSAEQLKTGYDKMKSSVFCPSIPEFRSWCLSQEQDQSWLNEYEAWVSALAYESSNQTCAVSSLVAETLSEIKAVFNDLNPKSETQAKAFRSMYQRKVDDAKASGKSQEFLPAKDLLTQPQEPEHKPTACPAHLLAQIKGVNKQEAMV